MKESNTDVILEEISDSDCPNDHERALKVSLTDVDDEDDAIKKLEESM